MNAPLLSKDELQMVKEALILPIMMDYIQDDIHLANQSGFKLDLLLVHSLEQVQGQIFQEHYALKRALRERGIKLFPEKRTDTGIDADYLCRGYTHHITLLWDILRTEVLTKASHYMNVKLTSG
ncbi:hypothetical protein [Paenibacillus hexagrammi]|uniref:Uncharacterized protein n=1 Tax=Paenibacillus hexagrammi TaxID=2908839 RepID=A0ABY3SFD2_9BACL|nr:hypothetical protein [Paenibacillus sp. YPD9-1]UJF32158.1 hypothetical protein L0M14_20860 [Paenibacillus sp. YPD9-1]